MFSKIDCSFDDIPSKVHTEQHNLASNLAAIALRTTVS